MSNETWTLYTQQSSGWGASYTAWLIAIVVIASCFICFFLFLFLANSYRSSKLLHSLLPQQVLGQAWTANPHTNMHSDKYVCARCTLLVLEGL